MSTAVTSLFVLGVVLSGLDLLNGGGLAALFCFVFCGVALTFRPDVTE